MKTTVILISCLALFGVRADASGFGTSLSHAEQLLETGKPDSAAVLLYDLLDAIDKDDEENRVRALYYLAMAMKELGRLPDEINYLIMAREAGDEVEYADEVRLAYARILLETGNFDGCIAIAREFKERYRDSPLMPEMLFIAGKAHYMRGDYLRASNAFNDITQNYPESKVAPEAIEKEGVCLYHLNLLSGATDKLEEYVRGTPNGASMDEALYFLGLSYERREQYGQAAAYFNRLVLEYPSHPKALEIYFRLGELFFRTNRFADAENAFENYVFNTPRNDEKRDEALFYLERIRFKTGRYASETEIAENFITKYPDSPRAPKLLFDLARYYIATGRYEDALEKYRILLNNPLYEVHADSAAYLTADLFDRLDQKDKARVFLIRLADETVDPERAQKMYLKLGRLNEKWELYDEAIGWYDKALTVDRSAALDFQALWGIGRVFKKLHRWYEAAKTFERIIDEYPDRPEMLEIYTALSDVYFLQGRIKDSIRVAEKSAVLAEGERKNEILLRIAKMYEEINEEQALKLYSLIYSDTASAPEHRTKALMYFGDLSLRRGDERSALNAYTRILSENADSVAINTAKRKITGIREKAVDTEDSPGIPAESPQ